MKSPYMLCCNSISEEKKTLLEKASGGSIEVIPFIQFEYAAPEVWLKKVPASSASWIFTSKRAVKAVKKVYERLPVPDKVYAVGPNTAEYLGFLNAEIRLPDEYHSKSLIELLKRERPQQTIHFRGNLSGSELTDELNAHGIEAKGIKVYQTIRNSVKVDANAFGAYVFMSPSAAESFAEKNTIPSDRPAFCIGDTTAAAVHELGFKNLFTPQDSSFESLAETIKNYFN